MSSNLPKSHKHHRSEKVFSFFLNKLGSFLTTRDYRSGRGDRCCAVGDRWSAERLELVRSGGAAGPFREPFANFAREPQDTVARCSGKCERCRPVSSGAAVDIASGRGGTIEKFVKQSLVRPGSFCGKATETYTHRWVHKAVVRTRRNRGRVYGPAHGCCGATVERHEDSRRESEG